MSIRYRALCALFLVGGLGGAGCVSAGTAYPQPYFQTWGPTSGPVGTVITVDGHGFTGLTQAWVGSGHDATFNVISDTKLTVTVPASATNGQIALFNPERAAWSPNAFTLTAGSIATPSPSPTATPTATPTADPGVDYCHPTIRSISPSSGGVGTVITLYGRDFTGADAARVGNSAEVAVEVINDRRVRLKVPADASTGRITLSNPKHEILSRATFTFTGPAASPTPTPTPVATPPAMPLPIISSFSPTSGPAGTSLTVLGSGFTGANQASVGSATDAALTVVSDTKATVIVPNDADSGPITIANSQQSGQSGGWFTLTVPPAPTPVPPTAGMSIRVQGSNLVDSSGAVVQLRGVNFAGFEFTAIQGWSPSDPSGGQAGQPGGPKWSALKSWNVNALRIPLNAASWLGYTCTDTSGTVRNPDPGANYKEAVKSQVDQAIENGIYVILDLHWTAPGTSCPMLQTQMADADHALDFWTSLANVYKSNPAVIFELYNEPFMNFDFTGNTWEYMMHGTGGSFSGYPATSGSGNWQDVKQPWAIASFQAMLDRVRATGATNVVLIGGMQYAQDLSGWLQYRPTDPLQQMGAAWHPYRKYATAWDYPYPNFYPEVMTDAKNILAAGFPIVMTEVGGANQDGRPNSPIITTVTNFADDNGIGVLGWAWDVWQEPENQLIKDVNGTPTDGYGVTYRNWLLAH